MRSRALNLAALAILTGLCATTGAAVPAAAQQLDAGKPPAQIFAGTCAACHRSPRGLVRSVAPGSLPGFLRQHYTTGNDMAGTMASYVLGNGGTQQVAEPAAKQRARSEGQDVAARTPAADPAHAKSARQQKAGKKGQAQPAAVPPAPAPEPEKPEVAKPETPPPAPVEPAKPEVAATTECKVDPVKHADEAKPGTPPRQPASLLTLPGFPAPEPEPEPEPEAAAQQGCEPAAPVTTAAHAQAAEPAREPAKETPKDEPAKPSPPVAVVPADVVQAPPRATVAETPSLDIMREEVHGPRVVRSGQKRRAPPQ